MHLFVRQKKRERYFCYGKQVRRKNLREENKKGELEILNEEVGSVPELRNDIKKGHST